MTGQAATHAQGARLELCAVRFRRAAYARAAGERGGGRYGSTLPDQPGQRDGAASYGKQARRDGSTLTDNQHGRAYVAAASGITGAASEGNYGGGDCMGGFAERRRSRSGASSLPSMRGGGRMIKAEGLHSFGDSAPFSTWPGGIRRGSARGSVDNAEHSHHQAEDHTVESSHLYRRKLSPFHLSAEDHTEDFLHSSPKIFYIRSADFLHSKRRFFTFINAGGLDIPSFPCQ